MTAKKRTLNNARRCSICVRTEICLLSGVMYMRKFKIKKQTVREPAGIALWLHNHSLLSNEGGIARADLARQTKDVDFLKLGASSFHQIAIHFKSAFSVAHVLTNIVYFYLSISSERKEMLLKLPRRERRLLSLWLPMWLPCSSRSSHSSRFSTGCCLT